MRVNLSVEDASAIRAEANKNVLELSVFDGAGNYQGFLSFKFGSQGIALRLAGAINLVQQDDTSPIFPASERRVA